MRSLYVGILMTLMQFLPFSAFGEPLFYSGEEIAGRIVDADTNQPITGAVVVVLWILFEMGVGDGHHNRLFHTAEAVSDADGRYRIPAWGPKLRRPFSELGYQEPTMFVFKSGYQSLSLYNAQAGTSSLRRSVWNGKTVQLKRFEGSAKERLSELGHVLADSGVRNIAPSHFLYLELLKEEANFKEWPADALLFFRHVRNLSQRGAAQ